MKKIYTLLLVLMSFSALAQVETELTNFLNLPCNATVCQDIQLGACPGDVNSVGEEYQYTDYQVYYVTENVIIEYNSLTLRNCRLEFRNGANFVDNGIEVIIENDCDTEDNVTGIVFIGGGDRYGSVEEMNATLGISSFEINRNNLPIGYKYTVYNVIGQEIYASVIDSNTSELLKRFKGLNYVRIEELNKTIKILN